MNFKPRRSHLLAMTFAGGKLPPTADLALSLSLFATDAINVINNAISRIPACILCRERLFSLSFLFILIVSTDSPCVKETLPFSL